MSSEVISRLISELKPHPRNYNNHSDRQVDDLALSLKRFGQRKPIVTWRDMIVAGHGLTMAAQMAGWTTILTMPIPDEWDEATVLAYLAADNELARQADPDLAQLAAIAKELEGIDEEEEKPAGDAEPQIDKAEELREKWSVESGQMWRFPSRDGKGEHRLICGDCTDRMVVERVMGGEEANLCLTDPPYGLGDTDSDKNNYDDYSDTKENLSNLISLFIPIAMEVSRVVVLTPGNGNHRLYPDPLWTMAWFTPAGTGSGPWGFCCWQPILCYGKDPKLARGKGRHPDAIVHTESSEDFGHPCAKPIKFWEWLMNRTCEENETIYEPFSGSGTTLIACENLSRYCRAIEISPAYVAVALQRYLDAFGITPELIHD